MERLTSSELDSSDRLISLGNASRLARVITEGSAAFGHCSMDRFTFARIAKMTLMEFESDAMQI